jgi:uncharacterized protein
MKTDGLRMTPVPGGRRFDVRVVPRAARAGVAGIRDGRLLVRVTAAPVDGAANEAVVRVLAEAFGVARRAVHIVSGERSRNKTIVIE